MKKETAKLNKIAGQVKGLAKLIEAGDDCEKIIIQFQAVKGALERVFSDVLENNLEGCLRKKNPGRLLAIIKQIAKK
jgi:DNA-binding FrmR family transcriptional regulator